MKLEGNVVVLGKVIDALVRRFVYYEPTFGSEEFLGVLTKIIYALLAQAPV